MSLADDNKLGATPDLPDSDEMRRIRQARF